MSGSPSEVPEITRIQEDREGYRRQANRCATPARARTRSHPVPFPRLGIDGCNEWLLALPR